MEDGRPKADGERLVTPELAETELDTPRGAVGADRPRTSPRVIDRHPEPHARVVGRFRIDAQLGSGGMGAVFRAYDTVLDRAVALKVLHPERGADDGQRMRRVVREARAAAALVHPNAVTVFDVGEADGEVFIAMELLEGEDLRSVLERNDAALGEKLRWLLEAARALSAAHERGLVHRDVKPENMFVCKGGTLKLLDFGIAKRDDEEAPAVDAAAVSMGPSSLRTTEGRRVGTPRYMAPEQHAGESTDARTDEFAWGLVAFELLAGSHVVADLRTMTRDGESASPDALPSAQRLAVLRANTPEAPDSVVQTIARALEPRKDLRFASMAPIVAALENATDRGASLRPATPGRTTTPPNTPLPLPHARSRSLLPVIALGALVLASAGVLAARGDRAHGTSGPGACRVESARTIALTRQDRVTILSTGDLVVARDIKSGLLLERDAPDGGMAPYLRTPMFAAMGSFYDDAALRGVTLDGAPALLTELFQGDRGSVFMLSDDTGAVSSRRIFGNVTGVAAAPFRKEVVAVASLRATITKPDGDTGVQAFVVGPRAPRPTTIESGPAGAAAVATNGDRVAVAYAFGGEIHFALLDPDLDRIGDVMKVSGRDAAPAVAFAGNAATVLWTDDQGGKTRLTGASFTPGDAAFSAPKVLLDEPLSPRRPVTARLPDGSWTVAWVTSTGGLSALSVARIGPGVTLTGVSKLATSAAVDGLQAMSTDRGVDYWWQEDDHTVRIAKVVCGKLP